ncbi:MAG: hypothetical protein MR698_08215 [Selenomonas sp.]|nr:hypothetical protein [Selenomonas sp.]
MNDSKNAIRHELARRWWVILLCAILVSGALMVEKAFFGEYVTKSGLYYEEQSVIIQYPAGEEGIAAAGSSGGAKYLASFSMLNEFLQQTEERYDYAKFDASWTAMTRVQKLLWLQKHLTVTSEGGYAVFAFGLLDDISKDPAYLAEQGKPFLTDYVQLTQRHLEAAGLHPAYHPDGEIEVLPESVQVSNKRVIAKYGIVGIVLGALLGTFLLLVNAMRKNHHA